MKRKLGIGAKERRRIHVFVQLVAVPTMFTMFIAGIWHGAGLQFLIFGVLHGVFLIINHAWRIYGPDAPKEERSWLAKSTITVSHIGLTFLAVLVGFVFFRAETAWSAVQFLQTMVGGYGLGVPEQILDRLAPMSSMHWILDWVGPAATVNVFDETLILRLLISYAIIWGAPNAMEILAKNSPATGVHLQNVPSWMTWRPNLLWAILVASLFFFCVIHLRQTTVFLYFQF